MRAAAEGTGKSAVRVASDTRAKALRRLRHRALDDRPGVPLATAALNDQQRLAILLQGAALLVHLAHTELRLADGWTDARVDEAGRLLAGRLCRGHTSTPPQSALMGLVELLFHSTEVPGRGPARRAVRHLAQRWRQTLAPLSGDRVLDNIFDAAPFLWQPTFGPARQALAAEHRVGRRRLWLAGPGPARRRFLARATDRARLEELLADPRAQALWLGWRRELDPIELMTAGRLRRAAQTWERRPPRGERATVACAETLFALGRYERALTTLRAARGVTARLLRARCKAELGELRAAGAILRRLANAELSGPATIEVAELAVRVHANQGQTEAVRDWVARALEAGRGRWRGRARLVAALAAWDLQDEAEMARQLEAVGDVRDDPELAWRWHRAHGLHRQLLRDGPGIVAHLSTVLSHDRRRMPRGLAGRLWSDVALGRVLADDLPGAERAGLHALRLLQECDGPSSATLALNNLAEIRLRRGRIAGVTPILELSTRENRRAGNVRALLFDLELWARLELAQGRIAAALVRCAEARELLDRRAGAGDGGLIAVLQARALGWQGSPAAASAALGLGLPEALAELEPEERPATLALAGRRRQAADLARGTVWAALWRALAESRPPPSAAWEPLTELEPYRAARLIFDCELVVPGAASPARVSWAAETLRRRGAEPLAERLEGRSLSAWLALERHLSRDAGGEQGWADLVARAGYGDARLTLEKPEGTRSLVDGAGGEATLEIPVAGGRLTLSAPAIDRRLRALVYLIRRELPAVRDREPPTTTGGMVGDSEALRTALARLCRLAAVDLPLLILGESGTGKELAARHVHRSSTRSSRPFLAVNCAALSETLIMSDLFGHVRGAFTGADRDRAGVFESARGGTVFLDEIGDLALPVQGALLRVIQEGEIRRLGESQARRVDVRIVAATHRDLDQMVRTSTFRQDLYFRLGVATIYLPPLRERGEDILLLAEHFLHRSRLSRAARRLLLTHSWPGNVRELRNVLEVAEALADQEVITPDHLDLPAPGSDRALASDYQARVDAFRKQLLQRALDASAGNRAAAARKLGLTRQALSYLVRRLGLS